MTFGNKTTANWVRDMRAVTAPVKPIIQKIEKRPKRIKIRKEAQMKNQEAPVVLEVFRGSVDLKGKVRPLRRVGKCLFYQCSGQHVLHIDLLPGNWNTFYLKSNDDCENGHFKICMKEPHSQKPGKFIFRQVGIAKLCDRPNEDLLYLEWDFVGPADIYMRTLTGTESQAAA